MLITGTLFAGRYLIEREVGRGSFGVVFGALDVEADRKVALKVLHSEFDTDAKLRHRLRREAKLIAEMGNPHCVRVHDVGETSDGRTFVVMELLEGEELHLRMARETRLAPELAAEITRQTLLAIGEAHELGIVHRDLKPHNIFLCGGHGSPLVVKVLDFGIAKIAGREDGTGLSESTRLTVHGDILGTPTYMSPEQCRGDALEPSSDLYSIGVVLYEMLLGVPPFDDRSPVQLLVKHNTEAVPALPPDIRRLPIARAMMHALEKEPSQRFRTAEEFAAALEHNTLPEPPEAAQPEALHAQKPAPQQTREAPDRTTIASRLSTIIPGRAGGNKPAAERSGHKRSSRRILVMCAMTIVVLAPIVWWIFRLVRS